MPETRRDQQKLWLILFQIKAIRTRLNFLALQHGLFTSLALLLAAAVLIFLVAFRLGPLTFLASTIVLIGLALIGVVRIARTALTMRADPLRAASIADERAQLKGRLTTVLTMARTAESAKLWPYLVEETYGLREEFAPARVEPHWFSRSIYALLASMLIAFLALPLSFGNRGIRGPMIAGARPGEVTADIGNLHIRPADPGLTPEARIYADPATMQKLQDKLAREEGPGHALSRMMDHARDFADAFQDSVTGRPHQPHPPLRLRLTDKNPTAPGDRSNEGAANNPGKQSGQGAASRSIGPSGGTGLPAPPPVALPGEQADQLASGGASAHPGPSQLSPDNSGQPLADSTDQSGGASRGAGADPAHLYGPASNQPLGTDNFKIAIDAEPSDEASSPGNPAYIPPKVRVPLNAQQSADEPLARATVPSGDQSTIKRVFER